MSRSSTKTFLAFGCVHAPIHDRDSTNWLIAQIAERRPDFLINLGDFIDTSSISTHEAHHPPTLDDEYQDAEELARRINEAAPRARKIYLMGNHENRIWRPEHRHLTNLIEPGKHIPALKRWHTIRYRYRDTHTYKLGQLTFAHGFKTGAGVKSEAYILGVDHGMYVHAHTHQPHAPERIRAASINTRCWLANVGTHIRLTDDGAEYALTKDTSRWGTGIVHGKCDSSIRHGGSAHWDAELTMYRMAWE